MDIVSSASLAARAKSPPKFSAKVELPRSNSNTASHRYRHRQRSLLKSGLYIVRLDPTRHDRMAFPNNPNGMMAGMNPTAGMSEQEVQMTKMVRLHLSLSAQRRRYPELAPRNHAPLSLCLIVFVYLKVFER